MAIITLSSDGRLGRVEFPAGTHTEQNAVMRGLIGGDCKILEHVRPKRLYSEIGISNQPDPRHPGRCVSMLIDEDGHSKRLDINILATWLYEGDIHGSPILGNVIFVGEEWKGDGINFCDIEPLTEVYLVKNLKKIIALNQAQIERRVNYEGATYR